MKDLLYIQVYTAFLTNFYSTLQRVEDVMSRTGKKRWISVILHKNDYKAELAKLEKELDQALKIFHVISHSRVVRRSDAHAAFASGTRLYKYRQSTQ